MSDGKERGKRLHARKNVVDGYARRLASADSNHQRIQLVRNMVNELRSLDSGVHESSSGQELAPRFDVSMD